MNLFFAINSSLTDHFLGLKSFNSASAGSKKGFYRLTPNAKEANIGRAPQSRLRVVGERVPSATKIFPTRKSSTRIIFRLPFHDFDFLELILENYPLPIAFV